MDRESVLRKIRAINAKTVEAGCSEAEALAAAEMMAALIDKYGFSQSDLDMVQDRKAIGTGFYAKNKSVGNVLFVANAVADYCDCKVWKSSRVIDGKDRQTVEFFGFEPDVEVAKYLMTYFDRAQDREWHSFRLSAAVNPNTGMFNALVATENRGSFEKGMMTRLSQRLNQMKAERNARTDEDTGKTGTSLVIVKSKDVQDAYDELGMKLGKARRRTASYNRDSFSAGMAAANNVKITTAIGGGSHAGLLN